MAKKTPVKTSALVPQPHGGKLKRGNPGNRGGGRPSNEFKATLRGLVDRAEVHAHLVDVLDAGPSHPQFMDVLKYVTEHGYGKASQTVQNVGEGGGPIRQEHIVRFIRPQELLTEGEE